jgi:DNA-binding ferritin-like protein
MDNLARLTAIYLKVLQNHIATKTTYSQFHEKSESFYDTLFDVVHSIWEKRVDLWLDTTSDEETIVQETYGLIEEAKNIVYDMIKEKNSIWMDNLLRWLADKLEFDCGNARAFIEEETDEESNEGYDKTEKKLSSKL